MSASYTPDASPLDAQPSNESLDQTAFRLGNQSQSQIDKQQENLSQGFANDYTAGISKPVKPVELSPIKQFPANINQQIRDEAARLSYKPVPNAAPNPSTAWLQAHASTYKPSTPAASPTDQYGNWYNTYTHMLQRAQTTKNSPFTSDVLGRQGFMNALNAAKQSGNYGPVAAAYRKLPTITPMPYTQQFAQQHPYEAFAGSLAKNAASSATFGLSDAAMKASESLPVVGNAARDYMSVGQLGNTVAGAYGSAAGQAGGLMVNPLAPELFEGKEGASALSNLGRQIGIGGGGNALYAANEEYANGNRFDPADIAKQAAIGAAVGAWFHGLNSPSLQSSLADLASKAREKPEGANTPIGPFMDTAGTGQQAAPVAPVTPEAPATAASSQTGTPPLPLGNESPSLTNLASSASGVIKNGKYQPPEPLIRPSVYKGSLNTPTDVTTTAARPLGEVTQTAAPKPVVMPKAPADAFNEATKGIVGHKELLAAAHELLSSPTEADHVLGRHILQAAHAMQAFPHEAPSELPNEAIKNLPNSDVRTLAAQHGLNPTLHPDELKSRIISEQNARKIEGLNTKETIALAQKMGIKYGKRAETLRRIHTAMDATDGVHNIESKPNESTVGGMITAAMQRKGIPKADVTNTTSLPLAKAAQSNGHTVVEGTPGHYTISHTGEPISDHMAMLLSGGERPVGANPRRPVDISNLTDTATLPPEDKRSYLEKNFPGKTPEVADQTPETPPDEVPPAKPEPPTPARDYAPSIEKRKNTIAENKIATNAPTREVSGLPKDAIAHVLNLAKKDGAIADDDFHEDVANGNIGVDEDALDERSRKNARHLANDNASSNATVGMTASQKDAYNRRNIELAGRNKQDNIDKAIEYASKSPDPVDQLMAAYARGDATTRKVKIDVNKLDGGDKLTINGHPYVANIDADGYVTLEDHPSVHAVNMVNDGVIRVDKGSLVKSKGFNPDDDFTAGLPTDDPASQGEGSQRGLAGIREDSNQPATQKSMFGDTSTDKPEKDGQRPGETAEDYKIRKKFEDNTPGKMFDQAKPASLSDMAKDNPMGKRGMGAQGELGTGQPRTEMPKEARKAVATGLTDAAESLRAKMFERFRKESKEYGSRFVESMIRRMTATGLTKAEVATFMHRTGMDYDKSVEFLKLGLHYRKTVEAWNALKELQDGGFSKQAAQDALHNDYLPALQFLPPDVVTKLESDPVIKNAIKEYQNTIGKNIDNIRTKHGLPMNPNAKKVPMFFNMVPERDASSAPGSNPITDAPFVKTAEGAGEYEHDPVKTLETMAGSHARFNASQDMAKSIDPLVKSGVVLDYRPDGDDGEGNPAITDANGKKQPYEKITIERAGEAPKDVYMPKKLAELWNSPFAKDFNDYNWIDTVMNGAVHLSIGPFAAYHVIRLGFITQAAVREGLLDAPKSTWDRVERKLPGLRSLAAGKTFHIDTPVGAGLANVIQDIGAGKSGWLQVHDVDDKGNSIANSHLFDKEGNLKPRAATLESLKKGHIHEAVFGPNGVDNSCRRVLAHAFLHDIVGSDKMLQLESGLKDGTINAREFSDAVQKEIGPDGVRKLRQQINNRMGWAERSTRQAWMNLWGRFLPFLSSESGTIPTAIWNAHMYIPNPASIVAAFNNGGAGAVAPELVRQLAYGPVGAIASVYLINKMFNGPGSPTPDNPYTIRIGDRTYSMAPDAGRGYGMGGDFISNVESLYKVLHGDGRPLGSAAHEVATESKYMGNPLIRLAVGTLLDTVPMMYGEKMPQAAHAFGNTVAGAIPGLSGTAYNLMNNKPAWKGFLSDAASMVGVRTQSIPLRNRTNALKEATKFEPYTGAATPGEQMTAEAERPFLKELRNPATRAAGVADVAEAIKSGTLTELQAISVLKKGNVSASDAMLSKLTPDGIVPVFNKANGDGTAKNGEVKAIRSRASELLNDGKMPYSQAQQISKALDLPMPPGYQQKQAFEKAETAINLAMANKGLTAEQKKIAWKAVRDGNHAVTNRMGIKWIQVAQYRQYKGEYHPYLLAREHAAKQALFAAGAEK